MSYPTDTFGRVAPAENRRIPAMPPNPCWLLNLDQIEKETGYLGQPELTDPSSASTSTYAFTTDHVLYSKLRPNLNKVVCPDRPGLCTTELIRMRPDPKRLRREFLTFYLRSEYYMGFARQVVAGAKMPRMVMDRFWQHEIPLPHPLEQDRIIEILDQADTLRQQRRQADELSQRFLPALFHEMFGDPLNLIRLDKAANFVGGGTPSKSNDSYWNGEIPWISPKDMKSKILTNSIDHISEDAVLQSATNLVPPRSILIVVRSGILAHTFPVAITGRAVALNQDLKALIPNAGFSAEFLDGFFQAYPDVALSCVKRGATVHNINVPKLKALQIPKPSTEKHDQFIAAHQRFMAQELASTTSAATLETLFQTLLHRAFDGSLTAKWREGHAKELLHEMEHQHRN
jgi:type I restriction enzyme S subunit